MAATRLNKDNVKALKHVFNTAGFEEEDANYLIQEKKLNNFKYMMMLRDGNLIDRILDDYATFPIVKVEMFKKVCEYLVEYFDTHKGFDGIERTMTDDQWFEFLHRKIQMSPKKPVMSPFNYDENTDFKEIEDNGTPKASIKIGDYPKFNGKIGDWPNFETEFTATAEIQGMGKVLKENEEHDKKFSTDVKYKKTCATLYSILKRSCARGDGLPKITVYENEQDGYKAWRALYNHYYGKGNVKAYANQCLTEITKLKLEYNSPGGMEHYISKHQRLNQKLDKAKRPLTDEQKTTFFLSGIKDRAY